MVSRRGATRRKNVPEPYIAQEPPLVVNCICCHCNAVFRPLEVPGSYLDRRCPSCGKALHEEDYDATARRILRDIDSITEQVAETAAQTEKWSAWSHRFRWAVFSPIRRLFDRRAAEAKKELDALKDKLAARRSRLGALARSRYYTGEWFQLTHVPLRRTVVGPYTIKVAYGTDGSWNATPTSKIASGITAEMLVFHALLERVKDPASAIHGARITLNIYLPHESRSRKAEKLWSQIDCVLLTCKAAFVIESKRRRKRVVAPGNFEKVWSTTDGALVEAYVAGSLGGSFEEEGFDDESFALRQNSGHAIAFDKACATYPFERIYEQVVYVGTDSFTADCREFVGNVNVSSLGHGKAEFANIIEAECSKLDDLVPQGAVDSLAESLVRTYGDLNQKRAQLHAERIRNISNS